MSLTDGLDRWLARPMHSVATLVQVVRSFDMRFSVLYPRVYILHLLVLAAGCSADPSAPQAGNEPDVERVLTKIQCDLQTVALPGIALPVVACSRSRPRHRRAAHAAQEP